MTTIAEIFDLPERVHQGDYVLRLSEGVEDPDGTLKDYVVTPQLVGCFEGALSLIGSAVGENTSKGAYLHGSFGSGKSHFMAVLTLLLRGDARARSISELAGAVAKSNAWTTNRRFLVVPYHMIGATSMESAILGHYAEHVRSVHPEAPTPGFYQADHLFEDARNLRSNMGDEAFFRTLNERARGGTGSASGWGALGSGWDAAGLDAALDAPPLDDERLRLVGDLIDAFFSAARTVDATDGERFVALDEGLAVMSQHAQALGYDGLILFLDELILWLASHAADSAFIHREGQKIAKLVEAMQSERPIPIVSFIARQRDLRELVSEHLPGAQQLGFADVLNWWEARFDTITLEDRNLPAIAAGRVLRPSSEAARMELDAAFERTARVRDEVFSTLLTRDGDRAMFRQVYPFSPAFVQTLVAVSSLLQRERTAIKLMVQLLVDQGHRLELGDIIPVGDLFDVIAEGDEPFTQAMRIRFNDAKKLYRTKLLPLLESEHGVTAADVKAGTIDTQAAETFRNEDRLMKTLLLSALADGVEALRALTPARLAALNHGTVRSPIPGQEGQIVLSKCRQWAAQAGEIKVSDDTASPVVSLQIVGVDTESILENAKALDSYGYRIGKVRQLVFESLGIAGESHDWLPQPHEILWRGSRRGCEILFRNVREMDPKEFFNSDGQWRIVIDRPFDEHGHTPLDDRAQVQKFLDKGEPADTLVWLPWFFTESTLQDLGRLVLLDQVLTGNRLDEHGAHLSQSDREQARTLLVNQRDQMRTRIRNCLLTAYGISRADLNAIDDSHGLEHHFWSLNPSFEPRAPVAATFDDSLVDVFSQALDARYPDHPKFGIEVKRAALRRVLENVERAVAHPEQRVEVERREREEMRQIAAPLGLGEMGETHFKLGRKWLDEMERKSAAHGEATLTAGALRTWIEAPERRGLERDVQNLLILTFALQKGLSFSLGGRPADATIEKLDDDLVLEAQALPDPSDWDRAVKLANAVFGIQTSELMNAQNVAELAENLRHASNEHRAAANALVDALQARLKARDIPEADSDRLRTAEAAQSLLSALGRAPDDALVATFSEIELKTGDDVAMGQSLKSASLAVAALASSEWEVFETFESLAEAYQERAREIVTILDDALRQNEHVTPLADTRRQCQKSAFALLREVTAARPSQPQPPKPPPDSPPQSDRATTVGATGHRTVAPSEIGAVLSDIEKSVREVRATRVEISWKASMDENVPENRP